MHFPLDSALNAINIHAFPDACMQTDMTMTPSAAISAGRVRYFTPREIALLHMFPTDFRFPEGKFVYVCYAYNRVSFSFISSLIMDCYVRRVIITQNCQC